VKIGITDTFVAYTKRDPTNLTERDKYFSDKISFEY